MATPDLTGLTVPLAQARLDQVGLILGQQTPMASDKPKDTIISQNPGPTQQVQRGQAVDVTVSAGKAQVAVPDLANLSSADDARAKLTGVGLILGTVDSRNSEQAEGTVLSQDPEAGVSVEVGSTVNIKVSNGKVKVPDVVGKNQAQAQADLSQAGFQSSVDPLETSSRPPGTVLAQSPQGGTPAAKGTVVTITVAVEPPPPPPTSAPPTSPSAPPPSASAEAGADG